MVNYEIKYTNRKTLAIYITKDARVEVRCNRRVRKADIERFICEKEKWINEKLELMRNRKRYCLVTEVRFCTWVKNTKLLFPKVKRVCVVINFLYIRAVTKDTFISF